MKQTLAWIARHALLFLLLFVAILGGWWLHSSYQSFGDLERKAAALRSAGEELARYATGAQATSDASVAGFQNYGKEELSARIIAAKGEQAALAKKCGNDLGPLLIQGVGGVIENRKACFRSALITREIASLTALHDSLDARRAGETVADALSRHAAELNAASDKLAQAGTRLDALAGDYVPDLLQAPEIQRQTTIVREQKAVVDGAKRNVAILVATNGALDRASQAAANAVDRYNAEYRGLVEGQEKTLSDNALKKVSAWAKSNNVNGALKAAAIALFFIIISPFLIRLFCYHILAPLAERRPAIRIIAPATQAPPVPDATASRTSVSIRLEEGEELLVRQGYFQSASRASAERTQWFLDSGHPIMSLATGLSFLTRIGGSGQAITVSAIHDPFAEVAVLALPEGAACVLHPRAIAAVVEPVGRPLRIAAHWRLFSLHAWLTGQWRYYVFHGPARLVLKGGRGVRVEPVERGRIFAQSQLIGFSADIPYAVVRTGTFWPYFLGREPLLKDRVEGDHGVLIVEEAPLTSRKGEIKRGIEGLLDAGMKLFGM